jgi:hypothetical protein
MKASARLLSRSAAHSPARLRYRAVPSQRGFSEQAGEHLPGMALDDPLELLTGALQAQWKRYRKKLKRCQQKFSEKAVHDSRVETRRLLATN